MLFQTVKCLTPKFTRIKHQYKDTDKYHSDYFINKRKNNISTRGELSFSESKTCT